MFLTFFQVHQKTIFDLEKSNLQCHFEVLNVASNTNDKLWSNAIKFSTRFDILIKELVAYYDLSAIYR